jgi:pantetheine-phosphate adenylyltransferase
MRIAVYAGSFDPPTLGHEDLARRAMLLCDKLILAVGVNSSKKPLLTTEEKLTMLRDLSRRIHPNPDKCEVDNFDGLLIDYCRKRSATLIVRGLRAVSDFESELALALANFDQDPTIETIFLPTHPQFSFVSSSTVKELARLGGKVSTYLDPAVEQVIRGKFNLLQSP